MENQNENYKIFIYLSITLTYVLVFLFLNLDNGIGSPYFSILALAVGLIIGVLHGLRKFSLNECVVLIAFHWLVGFLFQFIVPYGFNQNKLIDLFISPFHVGIILQMCTLLVQTVISAIISYYITKAYYK